MRTSPSRVKPADRAGSALPILERQRNQPDIPIPFHALGGDKDKVWQRFTANGQPSAAKATTRLCSLDPDLFDCLQDTGFRRMKLETEHLTLP